MLVSIYILAVLNMLMFIVSFFMLMNKKVTFININLRVDIYLQVYS